MAGITGELSVVASVEVANPMTEVFIRETCNGVYKIIIRKKGVLWFKSEESFPDEEEALLAVEKLVADIKGFTVPLDSTSTTKLLPEPNATRIYKVIT